MFTSVQAGVKAASENGNDCFLLTPVDIPLIPPYIMKAVLNRQYKTPDCFVVPCYEGKKGHPLSIPADYTAEILESTGENGMKSITSLHEDRMVYLETNCESIILDMDTQEAYAELIRYYDENKYPTEEQCRRIAGSYGHAGTCRTPLRGCDGDGGEDAERRSTSTGCHFSIPLIRGGESASRCAAGTKKALAGRRGDGFRLRLS